MYRDMVADLYITEETNTTQRIQFSLVAPGAGASIMEVTGGVPFIDTGNLYLFRSANIRFKGFFYSNEIPFVINGWNADALNQFSHNISVVIEIREL